MLSPIDMLGRRPRGRADGFDETALMLDNGTVISGPDSASRAEGALAEMTRRRRDATRGFYEGTRVGIDPKWDAWFGALNAKQNYAASQKKRLNVDLMGDGPGSGSGFGRWAATVDGGPSVSLDGPTGEQDLAAAAARAAAARAEQARRQAELARDPKGQKPYTGMFAQPGQSEAIDAMADADDVADDTADAAKRRAQSTPRAKQAPQARRRRPVNKPQGGTYTTPR